jgi:hypothetical protein
MHDFHSAFLLTEIGKIFIDALQANLRERDMTNLPSNNNSPPRKRVKENSVVSPKSPKDSVPSSGYELFMLAERPRFEVIFPHITGKRPTTSYLQQHTNLKTS